MGKPTATPGSAPTPSATAESTTITQLRSVLIIDDEEDLGEILADYLGDDFATTVCSDAEKAIDLLSHTRFDLIISDMNMPKFSGLDIVAKVGQLPSPPPVVLITGRSKTDPLVGEALAKGARGFLSKPLPKPAAVVDYLNTILA